MSQSDTRQRYANKNANQSRPSRPNWGSEARDFRPVGQRYGSVLVLSGPKRKQVGPAVRKPIPRPVNLPSQRKDRYAEGSLLGSKQGRPEDSSQQVESTTHSLNTQTWQSSNTGTWSAPQEATSRTDEYGFPIRSEAPINAREFPTLAASKQSGPPSKQRPQHEQADAYFSLDDRDTLPSELKGADDRAFGSQREDHRPGSREDWRSSGGRAGFGGPDRAAGGAGGDGREGRPFRDDVDSRLFTSRPASESRRGAFGFHTQEQDRSRSSARGGGRISDSGGGSTAFGPSSHSGRGGSRIEEYGLLPGDHPMGRGPAKQQDDYVGPAAHSAADVFSSTLLAAGVAPSTGGGLAGSLKTVVAEAPDSEEDEELVAHYKELELIKAEEEEKDRQRALAAEAAGAEESGAGSGDEEGEGEGDTWEDAAEKDAEGGEGVDADDPQGLKPIDPTRWQQRQAEIEEEDRLRRERAEAKKRALEEAIARREEDKTRAAREASEAALAALAAADQPLPANAPQVVVPPPPPPPRTAPSSGGSVPAQFPIQPPPPPPPAAPSPAHDEAAVSTSHSATDTQKPASTMESLPAVSASDSGHVQQPQQRRPDFIPAPAPARPAWGQALYTRPESSQKAPAAAAGVALHNNTTDSHGSNAPSQREAWASHDSMEVSSYWRDGAPQEGASAPPRQRPMMGQGPSHDSASGGSARRPDANSHRDRDDTAGPGRNSGRGRRGEGRGAGRGRHSSHSDVNSAPSATTPSAPIHSTSSTPPPGAPSVSASSNAASDADAAAVAAAAKAAKAMENISLPALVSPVSRKPPVDILPNTSPSVSHPSSAPPAPAQDVHTSTAGVTSPLQREGSVVGAPQPQHSAPAVYDAHYGAAPELALPSSNSVPALDADEKHAAMFDGADMGENLLPSNILGLDDAPYPSNKPSHSDPVASGNAQILPMHDTSFSSSLDQSKTLSPITHARPYTCSDHGAPAHLGAPLSAAGGFPGHSQPPPPAHNVRDRLPDHPQLWGLPGHEWDAHGQQQQPPLHPPSSDLHLHAGGFGSVPVPAPGAYSSPSKGPQHSPVPGAAPGVSSAQPVFHNSFGYPSGTVFSMPSFAPNAQMHMPLVPTSKPPDWSNNGPTTLGWNAMHAHGVPQSRPVSVLGAPGSMQKSQESGSFQMQDPQGTHNGYPQGGVPMQGSMPGGHPHAPQPRMRLSDVEMQLPDNLGLGAGPQIGHLPLAPPQNSQHISQPSNMHVRSGGGSGNGGNGGNRSNNRTRNNNNSGGGGGMSGHNSGGGHGLGAHNSNFQSGNRGGAGDAANSNSGVGRGDGHRQHGGGHSGSETERSNNSNRRHGGRSRGGHGRNHGRRGRGGGHSNDNAAATAASLVSVE